MQKNVPAEPVPANRNDAILFRDHDPPGDFRLEFNFDSFTIVGTPGSIAYNIIIHIL